MDWLGMILGFIGIGLLTIKWDRSGFIILASSNLSWVIYAIHNNTKALIISGSITAIINLYGFFNR